MFCSTHIHDGDFKDVFFSNNHQWIAFVLPKTQFAQDYFTRK